MSGDYRRRFYEKYVSAFKGDLSKKADYAFSDSKLLPILQPWLRSVDRSAPCVDLGCGHGNVLHALQTLGFTNLKGVDTSAEQVACARAVLPTVEVGDILPFLQHSPDAHYGVITLFDVIEHLTKDEILDVLGLVKMKLRRGGIFVAHCPNGDSPRAWGVFSSDFTHETVLSPTSAESICRLSGLVRFAAAEHLGASSGMAGKLRLVLWRLVRVWMLLVNIIETGSGGSRVLTRNFAFKAEAE
jgi:SAM-dependent methyltransferase